MTEKKETEETKLEKVITTAARVKKTKAEESSKPRVASSTKADKTNDSFRSVVVSVLVALLAGQAYLNKDTITETVGSGVESVIVVKDKVTESIFPGPITEENLPLIEPKPTDLAQIRHIKEYYLLANRNDGKIELRTGGTMAWRYNNPGKIRFGSFARAMNALGSDGNFAIFSSYEAGRRANEALLFESNQGFKDMTLKSAIEKYAPKEDGYKTDTYVKNVASAVGVSSDTVISTLNTTQRNKLLDAIEKEEQFFKGIVHVFDSEQQYNEKGW